jgi:hypothetical protein
LPALGIAPIPATGGQTFTTNLEMIMGLRRY